MRPPSWHRLPPLFPEPSCERDPEQLLQASRPLQDRLWVGSQHHPPPQPRLWIPGSPVVSTSPRGSHLAQPVSPCPQPVSPCSSTLAPSDFSTDPGFPRTSLQLTSSYTSLGTGLCWSLGSAARGATRVPFVRLAAQQGREILLWTSPDRTRQPWSRLGGGEKAPWKKGKTGRTSSFRSWLQGHLQEASLSIISKQPNLILLISWSLSFPAVMWLSMQRDSGDKGSWVDAWLLWGPENKLVNIPSLKTNQVYFLFKYRCSFLSFFDF